MLTPGGVVVKAFAALALGAAIVNRIFTPFSQSDVNGELRSEDERIGAKVSTPMS